MSKTSQRAPATKRSRKAVYVGVRMEPDLNDFLQEVAKGKRVHSRSAAIRGIIRGVRMVLLRRANADRGEKTEDDGGA